MIDSLTDPLTDLYERLAETIAWCAGRVDVGNPRDCLRSPALLPDDNRNYYQAWCLTDTDDGKTRTQSEVQGLVSAVATRRADLLRADGYRPSPLPPDLAGGRLLLAEPFNADWSGMAEGESRGFVDVHEVPAWDTWVRYFPEPNSPPSTTSPEWDDSFLLCWIPASFLALIDGAIMVNPFPCLLWAADYRRHHYNTPLLFALDAAGLLR